LATIASKLAPTGGRPAHDQCIQTKTCEAQGQEAQGKGRDQVFGCEIDYHADHAAAQEDHHAADRGGRTRILWMKGHGFGVGEEKAMSEAKVRK
jgi:hypothetical protein